MNEARSFSKSDRDLALLLDMVPLKSYSLFSRSSVKLLEHLRGEGDPLSLSLLRSETVGMHLVPELSGTQSF